MPCYKKDYFWNPVTDQLKVMQQEVIAKYFPHLNAQQKQQFQQLYGLYLDWNAKINVISRKDLDAFYIHHVLHSLAIAKVIDFKQNTKILDVGSGGGLPGIPLAILYPKCDFFLIDSIGKKVHVIKEVSQALDLQNTTAKQIRAEQLNLKFDFVVSRAVAKMSKFVQWVKPSFKQDNQNTMNNGILYLKGGDLTNELKAFQKAKIYPIANFFMEDYFATKKVVYLPMV